MDTDITQVLYFLYVFKHYHTVELDGLKVFTAWNKTVMRFAAI
jgi:hypothetical protein